MTDEEKDKFLKEVRLVVLHDVQMALAKLQPVNPVTGQEEIRSFAQHLSHHITERIGEVTNDTADRPRFR
jgi:hypothetical protein